MSPNGSMNTVVSPGDQERGLTVPANAHSVPPGIGLSQPAEQRRSPWRGSPAPRLVSSEAIAWASQPSRRRRSSVSACRPRSVSSIRIWRPSSGSGRRPTRPAACELADRLRHRLRAHALGRGQRARRPRPFTVETAEHRGVRDREVVLDAQPAHQLAEHDAQLARRASDVESRVGRPRSHAGKLYSFPVGFEDATRFGRQLQVDRAVEHHARRAARDDRRLDHADRDAGHLPRHPSRPAAAGQQLLPALDDPRLPRRDERARRQPRPARRPLRARADVQPRLRHLHGLVAAADDRLDDRPRRAPTG